jgi:glycosyltransferase involved in cell wall biosynthesis
MLRRHADTLQLRHVIFVGRVAPSDIHRHYNEADIYIQSPSIDNMPLSVLEAFASGTPLVSTDVGGVPSMVRDGIDGLLVADDDSDALARAVLRLLADPPFARALAESARTRLSAYEWPIVREGWLRAYRRAVQDGSRGLAPQPVANTGSNSV